MYLYPVYLCTECNTFMTNVDSVVDTFEEMGLKEELLRGILSEGFDHPSISQQRAILTILTGKDTIIEAPSGTGKTIAFTIAMLQTIDTSLSKTQALVLAPSRELALHIHRVARALGDNLSFSSHACIGGTNVREDLSILRGGVQLVVGTPGRVMDMVKRKNLNLSHCKMVVMAEAFKLLSHDFKSQIDKIFVHLPATTQFVLSFATVTQKILDIANLFMREPERVLVKEEELTLDGMQQFYSKVEEEDKKYDTLSSLYETAFCTQTIIFCDTPRTIHWLADKMAENGFTVSSLHNDMSRQDREGALKDFHSGLSHVLITTDARGIDIPPLSLVINYDLPSSREKYIRRIGPFGRLGRHGRKCVVINFVTSDDVGNIRDIEGFYGITIPEVPTDVAKLF